MTARTRRIEARIRAALADEADVRFDVTAWERDPTIFFNRIRKPGESLRTTMLRYFDHAHRKPVAELLRLANLSEAVFDDPAVEYVAFNVFGCPWSTDIDVACQVASREAVLDDAPINLARLRSELSAAGYDVDTRALDVNLVFVDRDGVIRQTTVGCAGETHNIVAATYAHHVQQYPCFVRGVQESELDDRLRVLCKCILDNLELLIGRDAYQRVRERRRAAYQDQLPQRLNFAIECLHQVDVSPPSPPKRQTVLKSIVMKLIQAWIFPRQVYTKVELAHALAGVVPELEQTALGVLTRGVRGASTLMASDWKQLCHVLGRLVMDSALAYLNSDPMKWVEVAFPAPSTWVSLAQRFSTCPPELIDMVASSPVQMPDEFPLLLQRLAADHPDTLNDWFPIPTTTDFATLLPIERLCCNVLPMTQRSHEWRELRVARGAIPMDAATVSPEQWYAILRGAILESIATECVPFDGAARVSVGFLESKVDTMSTPLCAPDLLLVDAEQVVRPVEIKVIAAAPPPLCERSQCMHDWPASTQRAVKLAQKQLENATKLLYGGTTRHRQGVLCFVYIWTLASGAAMVSCRMAALA